MSKHMHRRGAAAQGRFTPGFRASLQPDGTLELLVYEDIGIDFWTGGGVTAKSIKQQMDANPYSRIAMRINSPGGDAFEGAAIYSLIKAQGKPVDVFVDGIAASAASIVAMAGDTITMGRTAMMMVHNAWTFCAGNADDLRKCADTLDKISQSIGQAYVDQTGKTWDQVKAIMDAETWMSAEECVAEGFATSVAAEADDSDEAMAMARSFKSLAKLKKVPDVLKVAAKPKADTGCTCTCDACEDGNCADCDCDGCDSTECTAQDCNCGEGVSDKSNLSIFKAKQDLIDLGITC